MMKLFLTSDGISNARLQHECVQLIGGDMMNRTACIVTTAASRKEKSNGAISTYDLFNKLGFARVDYIDIEFESSDQLLEYDVIYLNGGNPCYLLLWMKKSKADYTIRQAALRDKMIIGTSAGAMVLSRSIDYVHPLNVIAGYEPMHVEELADYSALGLIDLFVVPHYNRFIDTNPEFERLLRELEQSAHLSFERVKDGEAIIIHGDEVKFIRGESQ